MKTTKRAERRHHNARLLKKRYRQEKAKSSAWRDHNGVPDIEWCMMRARVMVDTPANCSCWMCGNPRKYLGVTSKSGKKETFQELMADDSMSDGLEDYEIDYFEEW